MIQIEIGEPLFQTTYFDSYFNDQGLAWNLDLIEIKRDKARLWMVANQQAAARSYNPWVKIQSFVSRYLVLKKFMQK